jgi:hypothetical protein
MITAPMVPWIYGQPCCAGFPPLRCAQSCGRPVDNPLGCPPPAHRPAAAHKLHRPASQFLRNPQTQRHPSRSAQFARPGKPLKTMLATNPETR